MKKKLAIASKVKRLSPLAIAGITFGITGLGVLSWVWYKNRSKAHILVDGELKRYSPLSPASSDLDIVPQPAPTRKTSRLARTTSDTTSDVATTIVTSTVNDFPLKKGSKGPLVKQLQLALMKKYGRSILPKYHDDSQFGTETKNALENHGYAAIVDETTFNVIIANASPMVDLGTTGQELYGIFRSASPDFDRALSLLQTLKSKEDYSAVSKAFKKSFTINPISLIIPLPPKKPVSLLSGMFDVFKEDNQVVQLRKEFLRIGLQYSRGKWTLSGFGGQTIITIEPANIWVNKNQTVQVPANMVLGNEVTRRMNHCLFENGGKTFLVAEKSIRYL